jgi:DNA-directed RNA polymerase specialized sigma24 family protein
VNGAANITAGAGHRARRPQDHPAGPNSFDLTIDIALPDEVTTHLKQAEQLREQSRQAQASAAAQLRQAARLLTEQGMSLRDVGAALGVSYQRAHQLVSS